ncbi:MAG: nucleotidyltransferase family protein [Chloroflexota bacterium]|nr:nucleotidyltransferase family protein [Chloroflexota bacterium]
MNKEDVLQRLQELKPDLTAQYKAREISLFGSFAREEHNLDSDIDVLVEFENGADLFDLIGLGLYLEEIFQCSVDVVPRNAVREEFRETIFSQVITV